jgi:hypothetical protein
MGPEVAAAYLAATERIGDAAATIAADRQESDAERRCMPELPGTGPENAAPLALFLERELCRT